jgi:hypothetical protein
MVEGNTNGRTIWGIGFGLGRERGSCVHHHSGGLRLDGLRRGALGDPGAVPCGDRRQRPAAGRLRAGRRRDAGAGPLQQCGLHHRPGYHFKRDGEALGATSEDDFLTKVHAFIDSPPKGAEVMTRSNGDRLIYDPKANLFAVADKAGAPRTLFQPRDGAAYWQQQKDEQASGSTAASSRARSAKRTAGDDNG